MYRIQQVLKEAKLSGSQKSKVYVVKKDFNLYDKNKGFTKIINQGEFITMIDMQLTTYTSPDSAKQKEYVNETFVNELDCKILYDGMIYNVLFYTDINAKINDYIRGIN